MNPGSPTADRSASSLDALDFFGHNLAESSPVPLEPSQAVSASEPAVQQKSRITLDAAPTGFELIRRAAMRRASEPLPNTAEVLLARQRLREREGGQTWEAAFTSRGENSGGSERWQRAVAAVNNVLAASAAQRASDPEPDDAVAVAAPEAASNAWGRVRRDVMRRASEQMDNGIGLLQARHHVREGRRTWEPAAAPHEGSHVHERHSAPRQLTGPGLDEVARLLSLQRDIRRPGRPPEHAEAEVASQLQAAQPVRESFHQLLARQQEARRARERQRRDPEALDHLLAMHRDSIIHQRQWWDAPLG